MNFASMAIFENESRFTNRLKFGHLLGHDRFLALLSHLHHLTMRSDLLDLELEIAMSNSNGLPEMAY